MFRVKLYLFWLVTVGALTAVALLLVSGHRDAVLKANHEDLKNAPARYQQTVQLRFQQLRDAGDRIARGEMGAYLYTIREYMGQMRDVEKELFSAEFAAAHEGEDLDTARVDAVRQKADFLQSFSDTLADKALQIDPEIFKGSLKRAAFVEQTKNTLANCLASAVDTCIYKLTYFPLAEHVMPAIEAAMPTARADFVIVLDERGVGRAHSRDPKWSNQVKFADKYPVVFAAKTNPHKEYRDIVYFEDVEKHYLLSVNGVRDEGKLLGYLVLGKALDGAIAADAKVLGADLTFLNGDKVVQSTLTRESDIEEIRTQGLVIAKDTPQTFDTQHLLAASVPLTGTYSVNALRAVATRNADTLVAFVSSTCLWLLVAALVVFVVGIVVLQIFVGQFMKPLEEIDSGVHRIISGDREYYFPFEYREGISKNLAENMNLMVAVLQGKPLPEEEDEAAFLQDTLKFVDHGDGARASEGVDLFGVSADEYYKALYQEFIDAQSALGNDMSKLTRVKFVEKIAGNETQLRLRSGKSAVRFVVQVADNEVRLHPVYKD